jgi:hypothetical protein
MIPLSAGETMKPSRPIDAMSAERGPSIFIAIMITRAPLITA